MRNTFRYSVTCEDYINFYQYTYKRSILMGAGVTAGLFTFIALYYGFVLKDIWLAGTVGAAICISAIYIFLNYNVLIKRKTIKIINSCKEEYLRTVEATITDNTIESNNLPGENEAGVITIYPYSIMKMICENDDYFYFYIGIEAKILPKRAIPDEMKEAVYRQIRSNRNCMKAK